MHLKTVISKKGLERLLRGEEVETLGNGGVSTGHKVRLGDNPVGPGPTFSERQAALSALNSAEQKHKIPQEVVYTQLGEKDLLRLLKGEEVSFQPEGCPKIVTKLHVAGYKAFTPRQKADTIAALTRKAGHVQELNLTYGDLALLLNGETPTWSQVPGAPALRMALKRGPWEPKTPPQAMLQGVLEATKWADDVPEVARIRKDLQKKVNTRAGSVFVATNFHGKFSAPETLQKLTEIIAESVKKVMAEDNLLRRPFKAGDKVVRSHEPGYVPFGTIGEIIEVFADGAASVMWGAPINGTQNYSKEMMNKGLHVKHAGANFVPDKATAKRPQEEFVAGDWVERTDVRASFVPPGTKGRVISTTTDPLGHQRVRVEWDNAWHSSIDYYDMARSHEDDSISLAAIRRITSPCPARATESIAPMALPVPADTAKKPGETVLEEAIRITQGARMKNYGRPKDNFARWEGLAKAAGINVTAAQLATIMILGKLARAMESPDVRDHYVDIAGYTYVLSDILDL